MNNISAEDVFYLSAAKTLLSSFEGSPVYKAISDVIDFVTDTQGVGKSALLKRIAVSPVPKVVTDEEIWKNVMESIRDNAVVEFDYSGRWKTETTHRRVEPYQILLEDGQCFLFGMDEGKGEERIFSLNRMRNFKTTPEHFDLPGDFEFSARCGGGKFGTYATKTNVLGHGMDFRPKLESGSKKSLLVRQKLEESRPRSDGTGQERGNLMPRSS